LNESRVEYLLIGGYAVAHYGHPRATGGIDVWVAASPSNAERVMAALARFGFSADAGANLDILATPGNVIRMGVPPLRIEIQTQISGVSFTDCYARRNLIQIDDLTIPVIDLQDLKSNKRAAGRYKDLADLEALE
jgi:hypothetical protein